MMNFKNLYYIIIFIVGMSFLWNCSYQGKKVNQLPPAGQTTPVNGNEEIQDVSGEVLEENSEAEIEPDTGVSPAIPSKLLEDALEAYQEAKIAWEKADAENALDALDEAYRLILEAKVSQDSSLLQEKNELRLLIAQRIKEIYASDFTAVGENHRSIPIEENKYVLAEIRKFQKGERKFFLESYKRSGKFRSMILEELKKTGLPEELSWLPLIESGYKVRAYSRARALGLWQFISSTGTRFGLKRDRWMDERMDPEKATKAAAQYLKELHGFFGDWTTAMAAYNCGEFRVQRLIRAQRVNYLDNFWDLFVMLPRETSRYVPRFIATLLIIQDPIKYGFELPEPDSPMTYETVTIDRPIRLSSLSKSMGMDPETLGFLNPELKHKSTPEKEYSLKVPEGYGERILASIKTFPKWIPPAATYVIHYVRRGETVSGIARRYRTSSRAIARMNGLKRNFLIRPGQRLKIPSRYTRRKTVQTYKYPIKKGKINYTVKRGDSLYSIASNFFTTVPEIKKLNNLKGNNLKVGQSLKLEAGKPEGASLYTVIRGDTPYTIAKKFKMRLNKLLALNRLRTVSRIYPGQKLWIIPVK
jgi:membrane-bound lytic murein transglycosylase D